MAARSRPSFLQSAWAASAGMTLGAVAVAANQQLLAGALYWNCRLGGPGMGLGLSLVAAVVTIAGGLISWRARAAAADAEDAGARRFLAEVSLGTAGIFLLAIVAMGLAAVLVPSCHR